MFYFVFNFRELFNLGNDTFLGGLLSQGDIDKCKEFEDVFTAEPPVFSIFTD